ncbi:MAG: phosphoribosylglycinamide formyltransferase [Verrucomicrobiota bacterium]|jgi:phosphoribosylglycinamide formyltransferase-1|nr:phosphoribosylglycinamide formyltransferase [Verrucomicrobiota bacterium]HCF95260.1 phosphoribosylglycinamide formyltransferase [Verrucomicrobiota bacterium]
MEPPVQLAVLLSGSGRTLQNLIETIDQGRLRAVIRVVISNSPTAYGLQRAEKAGIPCHVVDHRDRSHGSFNREVFNVLAGYSVELIVLAGFLRKIDIPTEWEGRILNIHPALLPKYGGKGFYGHRVHAAVIAAGEPESGCTVHLVDDQYDHGPILLQKRVPVLPADTPDLLAERVFQAECEAYPEAIALWAAQHRNA